MTASVTLRPAAQLDLADAIEWYESKSPGLSFDFRLALDASLSLIARFPDSGSPIVHGLRRALLRRFPHAIYYRNPGSVIDVVAILHFSRSPRAWQARDL